MWALLSGVAVLEETVALDEVDLIIAKDSIGVQVLGCVLEGDMALMKSRLILRGLQYKEDKIRFFQREVLDEWASQGKSGSHFVFLCDQTVSPMQE